jgi:hypothetical protein
VTPKIVSVLAAQGARIMRVAEVEHTLERAYLDLVALYNLGEAEAEKMYAEAVA